MILHWDPLVLHYGPRISIHRPRFEEASQTTYGLLCCRYSPAEDELGYSTGTLARWLGQPPLTAHVPPPLDSTTTPAVPTRPQDLKKFEQDLNRLMQDTATQRRREADPP